jgi:hypothetical protein
MKKIRLRGKYSNLFVMVDDEDYEKVILYYWYGMKESYGRIYAFTTADYNKLTGKRKTIRMHRLIMGVTDRKIQIDHIDRNGLNNQKDNLRLCNHSQNQQNKIKRNNCSSQYKGVSRPKDRKNWKVEIYFNGNYLRIGTFKSEEEAAKAYDEKAKELHGEFALLNFPEEG